MLPREGLSSGQTGIQKENIKSPTNSAKTEKMPKKLQNTKMPKTFKIPKMQKNVLKHIGHKYELICMSMSLPFQLGGGVGVRV